MISRNRQKKCFIHCNSAARLKNLITVSWKPPKSISPFVFVLFNTQLHSNKSFILNDFVTSHNLDILFLAEMWFKSGDCFPLVELCPSNYSFLNAPRSIGHGGGGRGGWGSLQRFIRTTSNVSHLLLDLFIVLSY